MRISHANSIFWALAAAWFVSLSLSNSVADEARTAVLSEPQTIAEARNVAQPVGVFAEGAYLVVWRHGWPGLGGGADIFAARLEPGTLRQHYAEPIAVCAAEEAQDAPQLALGHGAVLVAWQDFRSGRDFDVRGILLDPKTARPVGEEIVIAAGEGNQVYPAVAASEEGFVVVWQDWRGEGRYGISGRRISPRGQLLGEGPLDLAALGARPAIARSGPRILVAWVTGDPRGVTSAALLSASDGSLAADLKTLLPCCQNQPAAAGDGQGNFMTAGSRAPYPDPWGWGGPGAIVCARVTAAGAAPESKLDYGYRNTRLSERAVPNVVDAAAWGKTPNSRWDAGAPGGFPGTPDGLWPYGWPAVVHAGRGYLFAWVKGKISQDRLTLSQHDIWLRAMDGQSLAVQLADMKVAGPPEADETHPALVSGPDGEILLLYEVITPDQPRRIAARTIRWPQ